MRKGFLAAAVVALTAVAAGQVEPSHPLSQIHPVDQDFNMSGRDIYNISEIRMQDGLQFNGNEIRTNAGAPIMSYDDSVNEWRVQDDLNVSYDGTGDSYEIRNFFNSACPDGRFITGINPNGSYSCVSVTETTDDTYVNEAGDNMTGNLDMNGSQILGIGSKRTNFTLNGQLDMGNDIDMKGNSIQTLSSLSHVGGMTLDIDTNDNQDDAAFDITHDGDTEEIATFRENGTLEIPNGDLNVSGETVISQGSESSPSLRFNNDGDTGVYSPNSDEIAFPVNGDKSLRLADGFVVVGSGADLDIDGDSIKEVGGTTDASSGAIRLANDANISFRDGSDSGDVVALSVDDNNNIELPGGDVEIPNGDLDLSGNNISGYWDNNLCGEDRAVRKIHENGTVECTQEIQFAVDVENLSETLEAGNVANQSIDLDNYSIRNLDNVTFGPENNVSVELGPNGKSLALDGAGTVEIRKDGPGARVGLGNNHFALKAGSLDNGIRFDSTSDSYINIGGTRSLTFERASSGAEIKINNSYLNLTGSNLTNVNEIRDFFASSCSGDNEVVKQVYADGTYLCETVPEDEGAEGLSETLEANNTANQSIDLDGSSLRGIENLTANGNNMTLRDELILQGDQGGTLYDIYYQQKPGDSLSSGNLEIKSNGGGVGSFVMKLTDGSGGATWGIQSGKGYTTLPTFNQDLEVDQSNVEFQGANSNDNGLYYTHGKGDHNVVDTSTPSGTTEGAEYGLDFNVDGETLTKIVYRGTGSGGFQNPSLRVNGDLNVTGRNSDDSELFVNATSGNVEVPEGNLNLTTTGNITDISNIKDFFADSCSGDNEVVKQVYANGTYLCQTVPEDEGAEGLSETLEANNTANQTIDMDGNDLQDVGKAGVGTSDPSENLDVDGNASISSGGTSMEMESDGDVVVTLGS